MANEKENVTKVQKAGLNKVVSFRRRMYEVEDENTGEIKTGEFLECTAIFAGETVRFKADQASSKLMRVLMKMHGYPLYAKDGVTIIPEEAFNAEI